MDYQNQTSGNAFTTNCVLLNNLLKWFFLLHTLLQPCPVIRSRTSLNTFNSNKMVKSETSLKKALRPLFIASKLFGICPFSIKHERVTYTGTILSIVMLVAYCSFHLISVFGELSDNSNESNFVTMTINTFNRYSGIASLFIMLVMGMVHQRKILNAIRLMHSIDVMFQEEVNIKIDDSTYSR